MAVSCGHHAIIHVEPQQRPCIRKLSPLSQWTNLAQIYTPTYTELDLSHEVYRRKHYCASLISFY